MPHRAFPLALVVLAAFFACEQFRDLPPDDDRFGPIDEIDDDVDDERDDDVIPDGPQDPEEDDRSITPSPFPVGERVPPAPVARDDVELVSVDCTASCEDVSTEAKEALCYNCRCKAAMGGWMPSPEEMQCGTGEQLVMYDEAGAASVGGDASSCQNGSLFQFDCGDRARYGSITRGPATFRWLCRKYWQPGPGFPEFDLTGVIAVNEDSGATCYWDAAGAVINFNNMPDFDLMEQPESAHDAFAQKFYRTYGEGCVSCHDNDGFIFTPYLKSARFPTGNWTQAPYFLLSPFEEGRVETGIHQLQNDNATSCTNCHRISSGLTCGALAKHALGDDSTPEFTYIDPESNSLLVDEESAFFFEGALNYKPHLWMPDNVSEYASVDAYDQDFARARDAVLDCCSGALEDRFGAACNWSPIPIR